jgi:hypothetical protein
VVSQLNARVRVGFDQRSYNAARNCYAPVPGVAYRRARRAPLDLLPGIRGGWLNFTYIPLVPSRVDLLHTWNRVSWGGEALGRFVRKQLPPPQFAP